MVVAPSVISDNARPSSFVTPCVCEKSEEVGHLVHRIARGAIPVMFSLACVLARSVLFVLESVVFLACWIAMTLLSLLKRSGTAALSFRALKRTLELLSLTAKGAVK